MTDLQIKFIKEFGNKELTEGCLYITDTYICTVRFDDVVRENNCLYSERYDDSYIIDEILGHIPSLFPDVAIKLKEKGYQFELYEYSGGGWYLALAKRGCENTFIDISATIPIIDQEYVMKALLTLK